MKKYGCVFLIGIFAFMFYFGSFTVSASEFGDLPEIQSEDPGETVPDIEDIIPGDDSPGTSDAASTSDQSDVIELDLSVLNDSVVSFNESVLSSMEYSLVRDYVTGILMNMSNLTDYVFYAAELDGLTHYYLFYDLDVDGYGNVSARDYPYLDIYNLDGIFYQSSGLGAYTGVPAFSYGSFGNMSALIDNQFHFNDLYIVIFGVMLAFLFFRGRVLK